MAKITINFKPKQITKRILSDLHDRAQYVIVNRFGLEKDGERKTLEAIGEQFNITRERVRQIENFALNAVRKSKTYAEAQSVFAELKEIINGLGGVVSEEHFLKEISDDKVVQNHIHLYLVLGDEFLKEKENDHFRDRWVVDRDTASKVHKALQALHDEFQDNDLVPEEELLGRILARLSDIAEEHKNHETAKRWLGMSKALRRNPLGEWGKASSPNVKTRGVKDYAFLVMRKHGSPMHFREVAQAITETFGKKTHVATCHNELIKDPRFVLVGRGVYALKDWGYRSGVVRNVIQDILTKEGPLPKDTIVEKVLKERYLKRNTILVNLQNPKFFKKDPNGLYKIV